MQILYNTKTDLLYFRLDEQKQTVINKRLSDDVVLDIGEGEKIIGNMVKVKAVKNKVSAPFRETEVPLLFDSGLDADGSVFDAAVAAKVIDKSGTWYSYMGERLGQGRDNSVVMLVSLGKVDEVLKKVREQADESGIEPTVLPTTEPTGGEVGLPETLIPVDTALGQ